MRVLFFGMGEIGCQTLSALASSRHVPVAVITKPVFALEATTLARFCRRHRITLLSPESPDSETLQTIFAATRPEVCAVAGFHKRIPADVLGIPAFGTLNLHDSLLPRYRGPNATRWVLIRGESVTGVTVHRMAADFDSGALLLQERILIMPDDNSASLFARISRVGARLLVSALDRLNDGSLTPIPQDDSLATYFSYPTEAEMRINWAWPAERICNLVRGLAPTPAAWTRYGGSVVRIGHAVALEERTAVPAGTVVGVSGDGIRIAAADRVVHVETRPCQVGSWGSPGCGDHASMIRAGESFR